ncbi:Hypothetical protein NCS54_00326100 [Fusarium falciforme]|uniref:Hypothetical protein n=1 Tax=Fusarium falciforme TaxID=195108 RepID=UPI0023013DDC|nr:Hypothetical protein NCS54_00326100 [Fusarium falciforme]WAO86007.1 Hypothetical protein NCS54_00326100 [Fusarium falciforme]
MDTKSARQLDGVYDVVVVGAGISGINAAHHIQEKLPNLTYTILEGRNSLGGTWDLFRYPGIRSDTDLHSFGFSWFPWVEKRAIADGGSIVRYLRNAAEKEGIDRHMQFKRRVISANWDSSDQSWSLVVETDLGQTLEYRARFLILGTGYYDYTEPRTPEIPGLDSFNGQVIHPQFWPKNLDYADKEVVIVGSGATAITLLPNLASKAKQVTMLQRSPTYILSIDNSTGNSWFHRMLPELWSFKLSRWAFIWSTAMIFYLCRAFPRAARSKLQRWVGEQLPAHVPMDPHFTPLYRPWDQRLCFSPNGDFFKAIREDNANVVTDRISQVKGDAIILSSGKQLKADIIVTATGLKLKVGEAIKIMVDGELVQLSDKVAWRASMLSDVPNLAIMIGYVNASWTLGADVTARLICRLLKHLQEKGKSSAVPRLPSNVQPRPLWDLNATYVKQAEKSMPKCGDSGPWKGRTNYIYDLWRARHASITAGLEFSSGGAKV